MTAMISVMTALVLPPRPVSHVPVHTDASVQGVSQFGFNMQHFQKVVLSKNSFSFLDIAQDFSDFTNRTKENKLSKVS